MDRIKSDSINWNIAALAVCVVVSSWTILSAIRSSGCQCKHPDTITAEMQFDDESRGLLKKLIDRLDRRHDDAGEAGQVPVGMEVVE